jgi:hypothetical protein
VTDRCQPDFTYLAPAVTALADRMEMVVAELADILAAEGRISDAMFGALDAIDADRDTQERAEEQTGIRRLSDLCTDIHRVMRRWCLPERIERGNDGVVGVTE